jgi:DNA N-6-adenine-methyltransferase (Dam)
MARISSGKNSKQDYQTPKALIEAVKKRFGPITLDLAARGYNKVCDRYIAPNTAVMDEEEFSEQERLIDKDAFAINSLAQDWAKLHKELGGTFWLNCPFNDIPTWSAKCALEGSRGTEILLLIPYGTTKAFMLNCVGKANLYLLEGRLQFILGESFPKDCVICHYGPQPDKGLCFWDWKRDIIKHLFDYSYRSPLRYK